MKKKLGVLASALLMGAMVVPVMAQADNGAAGNGGGNNNGGGGGGGGGGRQRGGGGGGFANYRQQMMDNMKAQLGATDEEFAALQPKIEAVTTAQRASMVFGGRGRGGRGGNNGGGNNGGGGGFGGGQQSDVQAKVADLATVLENKDAKPEEIKAKLDALRDAKTKAKDALTKAQADLKGLLTSRQEAVLVEFGLLD